MAEPVTARITSMLSVPLRRGPRPKVSPAPRRTDWPQQQFTDNAPPELQEELFRRVAAWPDVTTGPSVVSVPGARGFFLDPTYFVAPMFAVNEFAHIHPEYDGSLHVMVSAPLVKRIAASGWGELHPRTDQVVMIYGPRDAQELEIVLELVRVAYAYSRGEIETD